MANNRRAMRQGCVTRLPIRMIGICAFMIVGAALGCGSDDTDDNPSEAGERVCEGDYFAGDNPPALADCTVVRGNIVFTGNTLVNAELLNLTQVDGSFTVWGNPILTRVNMPRLQRVGGYLLIEANGILANVNLPVLSQVNERAVMHLADVSISGNPLLPMCQAHAVRDRLLAHGFAGSVKLGDNLGTCP